MVYGMSLAVSYLDCLLSDYQIADRALETAAQARLARPSRLCLMCHKQADRKRNTLAANALNHSQYLSCLNYPR